MLIAYRARNSDDARAACNVLAAAGITSHIPDPDHRSHVDGQPEVVAVLVDNRCLGAARRALQRWISEKARS
jgi:hypothetical protein